MIFFFFKSQDFQLKSIKIYETFVRNAFEILNDFNKSYLKYLVTRRSSDHTLY